LSPSFATNTRVRGPVRLNDDVVGFGTIPDERIRPSAETCRDFERVGDPEHQPVRTIGRNLEVDDGIGDQPRPRALRRPAGGGAIRVDVDG
jgi:hypothetical protein